MSSKISSQSSVKTVWRNVAVAVFAVCFALLGLGVTVLPTHAADDDTFITIGEIYNNPANMQKLYDALRGATAGTTYAQIADLAKQTANAQNFRDLNNDQDIKVTFGGREWHVCYLSQTNETKPRPILTLWLAEAFTTDVWNIVNDTSVDMSVIQNYPLNMYGTSYIRSQVLNNAGQYSINDGQTLDIMVTPNANHSLAQFSVTTVEGTLTDLIVKPALVEWQRAGQISGIKLNRKNQNWDEEPSTGWYDDRNNYSKISGYGAWKDDYLWLPSRYEISMLWSANFLSESFWSRTGDENSNLVTLGVGGFDAAYKKYPVFPALHIDLSAPELAANLDEVPDSFGEVVYDGNDHHVAVTKPSWYRNDMQITYTNQKGENVTVVKDAGEYTAEITLGQLTKTTTITIAPQEITGDNNVTARPKTYDRTTNVTLDDSHYTLTGVLPGDNITTKITGAFTDFNVGEQDVNVSVKLDGAAAGNYVLTNPTFTIKATIDPRSVTVSNIAVKAKPYDGTNRAIIDASNATFVAVGFDLSADDLTVAVSGTYDQITVGHDWTVTLNVVLDGATAGNYVLGDGSQKQVEHCAITQREITVTINDQTVKVGDAVNLSARVTSGSLANGDNADDVYTLAIKPTDPESEFDVNNLPAGEYTISGMVADTDTAKNYDVTFVNTGKYTVLSAEAWDALQTKDDEGKGDNNAWLVIIIVIAVAAFIGALVGIGLVVRSHDRTPKPAKGKSNKIDKATKTDAELTSSKNAQPQAE